MLYLTYCSFYSQETSCITYQTASLMQKWAWFKGNVGVVKKSRALRVLAPPTLYMFLRLCLGAISEGFLPQKINCHACSDYTAIYESFLCKFLVPQSLEIYK